MLSRGKSEICEEKKGYPAVSRGAQGVVDQGSYVEPKAMMNGNLKKLRKSAPLRNQIIVCCSSPAQG